MCIVLQTMTGSARLDVDAASAKGRVDDDALVLDAEHQDRAGLDRRMNRRTRAT